MASGSYPRQNPDTDLQFLTWCVTVVIVGWTRIKAVYYEGKFLSFFSVVQITVKSRLGLGLQLRLRLGLDLEYYCSNLARCRQYNYWKKLKRGVIPLAKNRYIGDVPLASCTDDAYRLPDFL